MNENIAWVVLRVNYEYAGQGTPLRVITDRAERDFYVAILEEATEYSTSDIQVIEVPLGTGFTVLPQSADDADSEPVDPEVLASLRERLVGPVAEPDTVQISLSDVAQAANSGCQFAGDDCSGPVTTETDAYAADVHNDASATIRLCEFHHLTRADDI